MKTFGDYLKEEKIKAKMPKLSGKKKPFFQMTLRAILKSAGYNDYDEFPKKMQNLHKAQQTLFQLKSAFLDSAMKYYEQVGDLYPEEIYDYLYGYFDAGTGKLLKRRGI